MAAGAVALPYYVPSTVLGRDGAVAPSDRIVMGGIGMGGRGSSDLRWMLNEPDVQWAAVCDVRKGPRKGAKSRVDKKNGNKDCAEYIDMRELLSEHSESGATATILVTHLEDTARYGRVEVDGDGAVTAFREKQVGAGAGWINAGVYVVTTSSTSTTGAAAGMAVASRAVSAVSMTGSSLQLPGAGLRSAGTI